MAENFLQVPPNSTGIKLRTFENTVGANTVDTEAITLVGPNGNVLAVINSAPAGTEYGLATRPVYTPASADNLTPDASAPPSYHYVYDGIGWDRKREATSFHNGTAAALGSTAIWTPASGKAFRLMGFWLGLTAECKAATVGQITFTFLDGANPIGIAFNFYVGTTGVTTVAGGQQTGQIVLGNGYLSAAANNALSINLTKALSAGNCTLFVWGCEE